jgi:hypothetical protein
MRLRTRYKRQVYRRLPTSAKSASVSASEVAVRLQRTHAEFVDQRQVLVIVGFGLLDVVGRQHPESLRRFISGPGLLSLLSISTRIDR